MSHTTKYEKYTILLDPPDAIAPDRDLLADDENVIVDNPTIINLGGNMTSNEHSAMAMNMLIKDILGISHFDFSNFGNRDSVNIYSVNYGKMDSLDKYNETELTSEEIYDLTRRIFEDQIFLDGKEPFDFEGIKENFGNLYFFTHCYGSFVLSRMIEIVAELLQSLNFDSNQISELLSQITAVNFASVSIPKYITNINIMSMDDDLVDTYKYWEYDEPLIIDIQDNSLNIISEKIVNDSTAIKYIDDHNIKSIKRDKDWQSFIHHRTRNNETLELYPGGNAECISEIAAHLLGEQLARSIRQEREEKLTLTQMKQIAQNIMNYYSQDELSK